MPFTVSKGETRIHYTSIGEGPTVVLVQGLGLSSRFWFDVPETLASDPVRKRRVLAVDNRGTGRSDRPRGTGRVWSIATMADDLAAVLDDAGEKDAIVVGISMGGMIAQHFALRHPTRARGLVLFATTPGFLFGALPEAAALMRLLTLPLGGPRAGRNLAKLLLPRSKWHRAREIFAEWPKVMHEEGPRPATFAAHLLAASTHISGHRLAQVACPTIVVAGAEDTLIPVANARAIASRIPGAELEVIHDAGHAVFADDRDLVRRMVERVEDRVRTR